MRTKRPLGWASRSELLGLAGHAAMGIAMSLVFAMLLMLVLPANVFLAGHGSWEVMRSFAPVIVTFGIGATVTGIAFLIAEKRDSGNN
jgi:hypothetical protein